MKNKAELDEETKQILRTPATKFSFENEEHRQKVQKRNSIRFWGLSIVFTIALVIPIVYMIENDIELGDPFLFIIILWFIFEVALGFMYLSDRKKFKKYQKGLVIKAYVTDTITFRGYVICITYYDYLRQKLCKENIRDDYGETYLYDVRREDIIDIVVNEKKGKLEVVGPKK